MHKKPKPLANVLKNAFIKKMRLFIVWAGSYPEHPISPTKHPIHSDTLAEGHTQVAHWRR
jgi:hypothetical protein